MFDTFKIQFQNRLDFQSAIHLMRRSALSMDFDIGHADCLITFHDENGRNEAAIVFNSLGFKFKIDN